MGACRHDHDQVALHAKADQVPRAAGRRLEPQGPVLGPRDVHEQVKRRRQRTRRQAKASERGLEVVAATVVPADETQLPVALGVTAGHERVVDAGAGVPDDCQQRPPRAADQRIADARHEPTDGRAGVLHGQVLRQVRRAERPEVDHLCSVRVDDVDDRTARCADGSAAPRGDQNRRIRHYFLRAGLLNVKLPRESLGPATRV